MRKTLPKFLVLLLVLLLSTSFLQAQFWEQLKDTPFSTDHTNGFGIGDRAYLIQGLDEGPNKVWEYLPESDTWTYMMDFPGTPRALAIGDELDGKFYYGFGFGPSAGLNDLWVFDPSDMSFTQLPSCPCTGRGHPALIAYQGKIYMGSGSSVTGDLNDWWIYDIASETWEEKQGIPGAPRHHPFFFESGDKVYVGGGHIGNWLSYDINTEEWDNIDAFPQGRVAGAQLSYNGYGLLVAGDDRVHDHVPFEDTFLSYDPSEDSWSRLPPLPNGSRWAPSAFIVGEELYFIDGVDYDTESDSTMWKINLGVVGCSPAQNLSSMNVTTNSADLFWRASADADSDTLKWRAVGTTDWNAIPNPQATLNLTGLDVCQEYEFVITNACSSKSSFSQTHKFKTDGCCSNPLLSVDFSTESSIGLSWEGIIAANEYEIQVIDENGESSILRTSESNFQLDNLTECTRYEFQIMSLCSNQTVDFGESFVVYTKGCGACVDAEYCAASSHNSEAGYIETVSINAMENNSGNNEGYGNFTTPDAEDILIGEEITVTLSPGGLTGNQDIILAAWIDFNLDGEFTGDEKVIREVIFENEVTRVIEIPNTALEGLSRLRIVAGTDFPTQPCQGSGGEVEDYCINLVRSVSTDDVLENNLDLDIVPNPFSNTFLMAGNASSTQIFDITVSDITGRVVSLHEKVRIGDKLDASNLNEGTYFLTIRNNETYETIKVVKN